MAQITVSAAELQSLLFQNGTAGPIVFTPSQGRKTDRGETYRNASRLAQSFLEVKEGRCNWRRG